MAKKIEVVGKDKVRWAEELENGNILFFPKVPFEFPREEIEFLLEQRQGGSSARKNIAYKPGADVITNHETKDEVEALRLHQILRDFSKRATEFLGELLPYGEAWKLDYASFRPFQEKGRKLRVRARNDLLHVDAFPTRPLHGARILRFFININPIEGRRWITSEPFEKLAEKFLGAKGLDVPGGMDYSLKARLERKMKEFLNGRGLKIPLRSPYDQFMIRMHNFLKENEEFQKGCAKDSWEFPPGSCWAVFTDQVSHAAISGQFALEQTFLIPQSALLSPDKAPVSVLERLLGKNMTNPVYSSALFAK